MKMPTATYECNNIWRNAKKKNSVSFEGANEKLRGEISLLLTAPYEHANLRINFENLTPIPYKHAKLLKYEEISRR